MSGAVRIVVILFGAVVGGLWVTRAEPMADGAEAYRRAIALRQDDGSLCRSLAISLQRSGRSADAIRAYQDYLRLMPGAADAEQIKGRIATLEGPAAPRPAGAPSTTR